MATNTLPSRFANPLPPRRTIAEPVEDFAMISLESVETMLRDSTEGAASAPHPGNSYIPPPLFSGSAPVPVVPKPVAVAAPKTVKSASQFRFADLLHADGSIDTDAVYRYAQVPPVQLSAELLLKALAGLPPDIPRAARQTAIHVTVGSLTSAAGIPVSSVVADARLRHTRLEQFRDALLAEYVKDEEPVCAAITALEAEIVAKQAELTQTQFELAAQKTKQEAARQNCALLLSRLQEVVDCLEPAAAPPAPRDTPGDDEEEPPHLREDSVLRILGISDTV